ncbi:nucleotide-binding protein, partial [Prunus dulcis]
PQNRKPHRHHHSSSTLNPALSIESIFRIRHKTAPSSVPIRLKNLRPNLPKHVNESRLREFFSEKGEITDAKLMRTKEGKSRQFAFIGFRTESEAEEAMKYYNRSFLDTCRITCEIARKVGDPEIPRPWSRHSQKKETKGGEDGKKNKKEKEGVVAKSRSLEPSVKDESGDLQLHEFLEVMQPRAKSKLWANDTLVTPVAEKVGKAKKESEEKSVPVFMEVDKGVKKNDLHNVAKDDAVSDMDYFKSRVKTEWSDSESSGSDDDEEEEEEEEEEEKEKGSQRVDTKEQSKVYEEEAGEEGPSEDANGQVLDENNELSTSKEEEKEEVLESGRLFVRNLPFTATEDELEEVFSKFGDAQGTGRIRWFNFPRKTVACDAAKQKNPTEKLGADNSASQGSKTLKQRREDERKASEASGDTRAWNSLYMRSDTVIENIARKYGVSKSDLLDREADDLAVRIALGETQVIAETKKALTNAGVNVESLENFAAGKTDGSKRSNHVLLVKNLPYGSTDGELAKMFGKFGGLEKIVLPPTKTLALVVFLEPAAARAAFKGLAYKRYKDGPLYLEWAPGNVLSQSSKTESIENNSAVVGEHDVKKVMLEQYVEGISDVDADPDRVESRSLYVKNLSFKTSDESLKKHFSEQVKEGKIFSVKVKKHLKNGKNVSMGFGFIEFDSLETATNVCRDLQGTVLDGHSLILQLCHAKKDEVPKKVDKDKSSTKLLVKNVAFEATEKDLRQLFSPFGQIKSLRLPMKFGQHRGFAFVEFITKQEAENALKALSSTHLYGRHLVLERAKEGESLEELRARTAAQFTDEQTGFSRKRKHTTTVDDGKIKFQRTAD